MKQGRSSIPLLILYFRWDSSECLFEEVGNPLNPAANRVAYTSELYSSRNENLTSN